MVLKVGNWCFVEKILWFVVVVEMYWALTMAGLFDGLLQGMLFVVGAEGK
jgi:hypothetical protein